MAIYSAIAYFAGRESRMNACVWPMDDTVRGQNGKDAVCLLRSHLSEVI